MHAIVDPGIMLPPVRAKLPLAEALLDGTNMLNMAMFPFSDSFSVRVRMPPAAPVTIAVSIAILSKQLPPAMKFKLETAMEAFGVAPILMVIGIIGPSLMLKVKFSKGAAMPVVMPMLLILAFAEALQFPESVLRLLVAEHPIRMMAMANVTDRSKLMFRIGTS